jgi:hypothetical protein
MARSAQPDERRFSRYDRLCLNEALPAPEDEIMNRPVIKTCVTVLSGALLLAGCATAQPPHATAAPNYNTPATVTSTGVPVYQESRRSSSSYGATTDSEAMLLDTVFLRPVSLVGVAVGAAAWIVSLPFSLPSGSTGEAWDALVETPLNYTFSRPLGDISSCRDVDTGCRNPYPW